MTSPGSPAGLAPQNGFDAGQQLARAKGLDHVIVRAQLEPQDAVEFLALGGDENNGKRAQTAVLAEGAADLQTVLVREQDVQQQKVHGLRRK